MLSIFTLAFVADLIKNPIYGQYDLVRTYRCSAQQMLILCHDPNIKKCPPLAVYVGKQLSWWPGRATKRVDVVRGARWGEGLDINVRLAVVVHHSEVSSLSVQV